MHTKDCLTKRTTCRSLLWYSLVLAACQLAVANDVKPGPYRTPEKVEAVLSATAQGFGLDKDLFQGLWRIKRGEKKPGKDELKEIVQQYIKEIRSLSTKVDQMEL